ncbi:MAG: bifunctional adenosylcobinamide kinase/adenosylcobinamide-phosphate guanylyltransferase [Lachnospiraceae bacterium]
MELYLGGYAQGKLTYVLENRGNVLPVVEGLEGLADYGTEDTVIFRAFHNWFFEELKKGKNPEEEMEDVLLLHNRLLIICDEVGNGIVPCSALEREYRERLGRYVCRLAADSERVERILCGIGQRIK